MNEILFLSGLLVAVSGIFLIAGFIEHQRVIRLMETLDVKNDEGTDTD